MSKEFFLGHWQIKASEGTISSDDETRHIEPKVLSVLLVLVKAEGEVVSREKLLEEVWPHQVVGDEVISSSIARLRKLLDDDRKTNHFIQTVPKKGYRLVQNVHWIGSADTGGAKQEKKSLMSKPGWQLYSLTVIVLIGLISIAFNRTPQDTTIEQNELSIAVLPFKVLSSKTELSYFADGLAEEILHQLVTNPNLKVMARSASFQYRNTDKNLSTIASELNVKYLLGGSVREYENGLRVTVQLIDARNNFHLWSRVFDESIDELYKIQQLVGIAISDMLNIDKNSMETFSGRKHPQSEHAYKYFVMGQAYMQVATVKSYEQALSLFEKAVALSPDYALAYVGKAASHLLLYQYKHLNKDAAILQASIDLEKSLQLEPFLAEAYAIKGLMYTYLKQYDKAEQFYRRALKLNPNMGPAHHNYAFMLWQQSRFEQAIGHAEIALATNPLSKKTYFAIGDSLASLAEFDMAIAHYQHCQHVLPDYPTCYLGLGNIYQVIGELDKAQSNLKLSASVSEPESFWHNTIYASLLIHQGDFERADSILKNMNLKNPTNYYLLRSRWLNALALNNIEHFFESIDQLSKRFMDDIDVKKFQALKAYWERDYKLAVSLYEEILKDEPQFIFNIWDYSDGISHGIILAISYEITAQGLKKQKLLMQIEQHLSSFSKQLQKVPGALYIKAQYSDLVGDRDKSEQLLLQLQQNWALKWLPGKDPFWQL